MKFRNIIVSLKCRNQEKKLKRLGFPDKNSIFGKNGFEV